MCLFIYNMLLDHNGTQRINNLEKQWYTYVHLYIYDIELIQSEYLFLEYLVCKFSYYF